ncbi:MAG: NAD(P)/FAD-dependent oxidoreductase [Smithella sp.]
MQQDKKFVYDVIVVGGGAAGLMAAGKSGLCGAHVLLLEKTDSCGKKILVSGKTRCNLTNAADLKDFITMYGRNGRFLYHAFHHFFRPELLKFFNDYGVSTKLERGGRIFPASDDAHEVVRALERYLADNRVQIKSNIKVTAIQKKKSGFFEVQTSGETYSAKAVILATGGASWPQTGSTGDGYKISSQLGHNVVDLKPALVPLIVEEIELTKSMEGLNLRNVRATAFQGRAKEIDAQLTPQINYGRGEKKTPRAPVIESRFGEMLFTHFGLAGPIILLMSLAVVEALAVGPVSILIDLKPALTREQIRVRLQKDFDSHGKRKISEIMKEYLLGKMIKPFLALTSLDPEKQAHQIKASEKDEIIEHLKALRFNIKSALPLSRAIVTAGGVALAEIDPRTMASKLIPGLYFCGEVMDIDADTGGYNLQAAFSTGYLAGECAAKYSLSFPFTKI